MSTIPPRALGLCAALLLALPCAAYTPDPPPVIEILDTQEEGSATLILETAPPERTPSWTGCSSAGRPTGSRGSPRGSTSCDSSWRATGPGSSSWTWRKSAPIRSSWPWCPAWAAWLSR
ncbi:MAG: hypothetical protein M0C28_48625 [Candidatus Moduliflexus flocculans]|nr:hypothetical protein [Candidatus Moduliflexus flocculans]